MPKSSDHEWLLAEAKKVAAALAETLAPLCEVVLHDLTHPKHTIAYIGNNLSGRSVGDPATELGLARLADPKFPDVVANYANKFADGRPAKSTSIGLRDKSGKYVAAICLNLDLSHLRGISGYLNALMQISPKDPEVKESLAHKPSHTLEAKILQFAARRNRDPSALSSDEKRQLMRQLTKEGDLEIRGASERIGALLGLSRSNVYYYMQENRVQVGEAPHESSRSL